MLGQYGWWRHRKWCKIFSINSINSKVHAKSKPFILPSKKISDHGIPTTVMMQIFFWSHGTMPASFLSSFPVPKVANEGEPSAPCPNCRLRRTWVSPPASAGGCAVDFDRFKSGLLIGVVDVGGGGCWRVAVAFGATSTFTDRPFLALAFGVVPESVSTAGALTGVATGFPPQTCFWI